MPRAIATRSGWTTISGQLRRRRRQIGRSGWHWRRRPGGSPHRSERGRVGWHRSTGWWLAHAWLAGRIELRRRLGAVPNEDVKITLLLTDGSQTSLPVHFVGNGGEPFALGDLNFDGTIEADDHGVSPAGLHTDVSGMTIVEAYVKGDMNEDLVTNYRDFDSFGRSTTLRRAPVLLTPSSPRCRNHRPSYCFVLAGMLLAPRTEPRLPGAGSWTMLLVAGCSPGYA